MIGNEGVKAIGEGIESLKLIEDLEILIGANNLDSEPEMKLDSLFKPLPSLKKLSVIIGASNPLNNSEDNNWTSLSNLTMIDQLVLKIGSNNLLNPKGTFDLMKNLSNLT